MCQFVKFLWHLVSLCHFVKYICRFLYVNFSESKSSQLEFVRYECRLINVDMSIYQWDISDISQDSVVDFSDVMLSQFVLSYVKILDNYINLWNNYANLSLKIQYNCDLYNICKIFTNLLIRDKFTKRYDKIGKSIWDSPKTIMTVFVHIVMIPLAFIIYQISSKYLCLY